MDKLNFKNFIKDNKKIPKRILDSRKESDDVVLANILAVFGLFSIKKLSKHLFSIDAEYEDKCKTQYNGHTIEIKEEPFTVIKIDNKKWRYDTKISTDLKLLLKIKYKLI